MMSDLKFISLKIMLVVVICHHCYASHIRLTNIYCNTTDPKYARVDWCILKAVSRNVQYFTLKITIFDLPITDMAVRVQLMKRLSGWRPFLYDRIFSCNFTKNLNALTRPVWKIIKQVTNVNHDCPYNQAFIVPPVNNTFIKDAISFFPIPSGVYGLFFTVNTYNITRGFASFHISVE